MKKKIFISCFVGLIGFLCCGCGVSSLLGKNVCPHENYEIGKVRYEHGPCCEDQMTVYTICKDCGEEVIAGTIPSDSKCSMDYNSKEVIREATCTEEGMYTWICAWCDHKYSVPTRKVGHLYLHFLGDDTAHCVDCGKILEEASADDHVHEYEQTHYLEYSNDHFNKYPGERFYCCKYCDDVYKECFDEFGGFAIETVRENIQKEAQTMGYVVIADNELEYTGDVRRFDAGISYQDTNSKDFVADATEIGKRLLISAKYKYHTNPAECYLSVSVDYNYTHTAPYFSIRVYVLFQENYDELHNRAEPTD